MPSVTLRHHAPLWHAVRISRFVPKVERHGDHVAGYSSVGRASDCRVLQQSDGPWFDSGWPDFWKGQNKLRSADVASQQFPDALQEIRHLDPIPGALK